MAEEYPNDPRVIIQHKRSDGADLGDVSEDETGPSPPQSRQHYGHLHIEQGELSGKERSDSESSRISITSKSTIVSNTSKSTIVPNTAQSTVRSSPESALAQPPSVGTPLETVAPEDKTENTPKSKKSDDPPPRKQKNKVTIVFAGKSGAGKSTLAKKLFGFPVGSTKPSANPITKAHEKLLPTPKDGVTINIIDMAGYNKKDKKKQLKELSKLSNGEADLVLYCLPISPNSKFDDLNPDIMASLQDAFGKDIWNHCMVVLTFSNYAWDHIEMTHEGEEDQEIAVTEYKGLIDEYITKFREQLDILKVEGVDVISVFDIDFSKEKGENWEIVCIPAGFRPRDPVLQGVKYPKADKPLDSSRSNSTSGDSSDDTSSSYRPVNIPGNYPPEPRRERGGVNTLPVVEASGEWPTVLKAEILNRSTYETQVALLTYWYSRKRIERALKNHKTQVLSSMGGGIAGGVAGGAIGGGAGLVIGLAGGPVGMGIGLVLGTTGGIIAGTLAGGGTATAVTHGLAAAGQSEEEEAQKEEEKEDTPQA